MTNSKTVYNDFVRANLPEYIRYDSVRNQYVTVNGKRFVTYKEAKWYTDYIIKNGSIIDRAIGFNIPQTIADFSDDTFTYSKDGNPASTTAENLLTHTRAGTATYTDSTGTLQTAATNELRKDNHIWDGSSWVKRCLVEPQSTNLVTYSSEFDNAAWTKSRVTVTANAITAPDGTLSADKITENDTSAGSTHSVLDNVSASGSTIYTQSVFLKAAERSWVQIKQFDGTTNLGAFFDIANGAIGTVDVGITANIQNYGNGWYRCSVTNTTASGATLERLQVNLAISDGSSAYDGDGTSGIYVYGAQLEASSVPTSYIPTAGAQVTRPADALSIDSTLLPYDSTAMTIAMDGEVTYADEGGFNTVIFIDWFESVDDSIDLNISTNSTETGSVFFSQEAVTVIDNTKALNAYSSGINVPFNIASRHTSSDLNGAVDGTALTANTTPTALPDLSATDFKIAPTGVINIKSLRILGGYGATDVELEAATVS